MKKRIIALLVYVNAMFVCAMLAFWGVNPVFGGIALCGVAGGACIYGAVAINRWIVSLLYRNIFIQYKECVLAWFILYPSWWHIWTRKQLEGWLDGYEV